MFKTNTICSVNYNSFLRLEYPPFSPPVRPVSKSVAHLFGFGLSRGAARDFVFSLFVTTCSARGGKAPSSVSAKVASPSLDFENHNQCQKPSVGHPRSLN
jgi:hypothetical protein